MTDKINVPGQTEPHEVSLAAGQALFVLGANGSGKSSLMHHLASKEGQTYWAAAHRPLWIESPAPQQTPEQYEQSFREHTSWRNQEQSRWLPLRHSQYEPIKTTLTALRTAQRLRDREIVETWDQHGAAIADKVRIREDDPLQTISNLFKLANLPITLSLDKTSEKFVATREGKEYPINQLSDGERSAFVLFASILTQAPGTLFLIDEPERHLHRSIVCPVLEAMFNYRSDCRFVVSTHEVALPLEFPESKILILRGCNFSGSKATSWEADLTSVSSELSEELKVEVWGSRRNIVFVEGAGTASKSLDTRLYRLLLPEATIRPKRSWQEVVETVEHLAASGEYTWVTAQGLVDGDRQAEPVVVQRPDVRALEVSAVESLYYHPAVQRRIAAPRCKQQQRDLDECLASSVAETLAAYEQSVKRGAVEPVSRPDGTTDDAYAEMIVKQCPIKKTDIPKGIANSLGFNRRRDYEDAVRDRLVDDAALRESIFSLDSGLRALRDILN